MKNARLLALVATALLAGCCGPYSRPDDSYLRPGTTLNAYKNISVVPLNYDPDGIEMAVSNELARVGFRLVSAQDVRASDEEERLATLVCLIKVDYYPTSAVTLEFRDLKSGKVGDKVFASRAQTGLASGSMKEVAKLAVSHVREQYTGYDETAMMAPYSGGEAISLSREQLTEYIDKHGASLDPLEGIWSEDDYTYEVGIMRDSISGPGRDFVAFILSTSAATWKPGQVKAEFTRTSNPGVFRATFYMRDHSKQSSVATLDGNQLKLTLRDPARDSEYEVTFARTYPASLRGVSGSSELPEARRDAPSVGTGFLVSSDGMVATNFHVVDGIKAIEVYFPAKDVAFDARVMFKDKLNDIVLLKLQGFTLSKLTSDAIPYAVGTSADVGPGTDVFTLGFPLSTVLGQSAKFSSGTISSLSGLDDDPRLMQVSNPVQPGNSGGPLFNHHGEVVGIVVSSLNARYFYERASILPQNVNFAVKADFLRSLIAMSPGGKGALERTSQLQGKSVEEQVKLITPFIVAIRELR